MVTRRGFFAALLAGTSACASHTKRADHIHLAPEPSLDDLIEREFGKVQPVFYEESNIHGEHWCVPMGQMLKVKERIETAVGHHFWTRIYPDYVKRSDWLKRYDELS